uniref:Uncharacterized protein n=1 Tax=Physcomitrium patens TaxID=3218 RepID=A0A2K1IZY2_PHYPA|nr:hypothetical protein PHYPA_022726 [Physcomitrium patens]
MVREAVLFRICLGRAEVKTFTSRQCFERCWRCICVSGGGPCVHRQLQQLQ